MSADTALRANVRLLGDLLGRVLVEQEGQDLLDDEERIRALARDARAGGSRGALGDAVAALGLGAPGRGAAGVRALLPARQHRRAAPPDPPAPRVRGRGAGAARVARRRVRAARPERASTRQRSRRPARGSGSSSSSRPTRPRRRAARSSRRTAAIAALLDPPRRRGHAASRSGGGSRTALAEEITLLWQTDEIRSKRPRVVDEIRQGLWFFEQSFWNAIPELERALVERLAGAGEALRFGTLDRR